MPKNNKKHKDDIGFSSKSESREALCLSLAQNNIKYKRENWTNFMENVVSMDAIVVDVKNREQAVALVKILYDINQQSKEILTLRPVAGWADKESNCGCFSFFKQLIKGSPEKYNESFTFNNSTVGDVILRFGPKFQTITSDLKKLDDKDTVFEVKSSIHNLPRYEVTVSAGVQIEAFEQYLAKHGLSMSTASMINKVSVVGLAITGHGTGKNEPSFAGLIREIELLMPNGDIRHLDYNEPEFKALIPGHLGLAGIVLSMKLEVTKQFKLKEKAFNYIKFAGLYKNLPQLMDKDYFTLHVIPVYNKNNVIPCIQVRTWELTEDPINVSEESHCQTAESVAQELAVEINNSVQNLLFHQKLHNLIPYYMSFVAASVTQLRGQKDIVDWANNIFHYQTNFPRDLRDLSYLIPVSEEEKAERLIEILKLADDFFADAQDNDEFPISYALYARYIKGKNGGLSTMASHGERDHMLIAEMVSHPLAPGFDRLGDLLADMIKDKTGFMPRCHSGKEILHDFPYDVLLGKETVNAFIEALKNWHGDEEAFLKNPLLTAYLKDKLSLPVSLSERKLLDAFKQASPGYEPPSDECCIQELKQLMAALKKMEPINDIHKKAIEDFCFACEKNMNDLEVDLHSPLALS